ncbi:hypothetical protein M407DRAFT_220899 [Tulasnella calospora MUT 4182]|uniref:Uncharacterized protein n=1 Tax=Tulasnella calospora MUT 4182 TaxID=1051891 RepID=A0A0C3QR51_9AGAM|nr:hypothetical protein M407DRAFT_220899 [Tulasnella calospora MUT 4182]
MSSVSSSSRSPSPEPIELPTQLSELCELTASRPESLVHGDTGIQTAALRATKFLFDRGVLSEADAAPAMNELLKSIDIPQPPVTRSQVAKQKAGTAPPPKEPITFGRTPLSSLVLDGMGADQIWAQLELRAKNICAVLDSIIDREPDDDEAEGGAEGEDMDVDQGAGPSGSNGVTRPFGLGDEEESEEESDESSDGEDLGEDIVKLRDHEEEEEEEPPVVGLRQPRRRSQQPIWRGPRHPTLDDGFFGIDKFNRDTELMEAKHKSRGRLGGDDDDSAEEEAINLFAPIDGGSFYQPKATISTLSNVASASLESALPASVSTSTILAPEEMFAFDPRATTSKTEMSPGEKKALRTKVKHERKAQGQMINGAVVKFSNNAGGSATAAAGLKNGKQPKNAKEAKDAALESLVKTGKGVTVVGKPHVGKSTNVKDKAREGGASLKL